MVCGVGAVVRKQISKKDPLRVNSENRLRTVELGPART